MVRLCAISDKLRNHCLSIADPISESVIIEFVNRLKVFYHLLLWRPNYVTVLLGVNTFDSHVSTNLLNPVGFFESESLCFFQSTFPIIYLFNWVGFQLIE